MTRVLVTGVSGFVGPHLARALDAAGYSVTGLGRSASPPPGLHDYHRIPQLPTTEAGWQAVLRAVQPDAIFHLAAQSNVAVSWQDVARTMRTNIVVSAALLQAVQRQTAVTMVTTVGSSEEYGPQGDHPISEDAPLRPQNPYAVSKMTVGTLAQQLLSRGTARWYHLRPFNHFGPGQRPGFVVADLCRQIVAVERGRQSAVAVGNTAAVRDFLAVEDVVGAYVELLRTAAPSGCYNIASGHGVPISDLVEHLVTLAECPVFVRSDPARMRPVDVPIFVGNPAKIQRATGWTARIPLAQALRRTLDWWRETGG